MQDVYFIGQICSLPISNLLQLALRNLDVLSTEHIDYVTFMELPSFYVFERLQVWKYLNAEYYRK